MRTAFNIGLFILGWLISSSESLRKSFGKNKQKSKILLEHSKTIPGGVRENLCRFYNSGGSQGQGKN